MYAWIKQQSDDYSVDPMCQFMNFSRNAYYAWLLRRSTEREKRDCELTDIICSLTFNKGCDTNGTRRLKQALPGQDRTVSRRRICLLRREADLVCTTKLKFKATTNSKHNLKIVSNLLDQQFTSAHIWTPRLLQAKFSII
jgi:putative transposase